MAEPTYGTVDNPVQLDPWESIVEVGWGGGNIAIFTVTGYNGGVGIIDPGDAAFDTGFDAGSVIAESDYTNSYGIIPNVQADAGSWLAELGYTSFGVDAWYGGPASDVTAFNNAVAQGTTMTGYAPTQVYNDEMLVFNSTTIANPDCSSSTYYGSFGLQNPWWASTDGYGNPTPVPNNAMTDYSGRIGATWYKPHTTPEATVELNTQSYLVHFASSKSITAMVSGTVPTSFQVKYYKIGTNFTVGSDGSLSGDTPVLMSFSGEFTCENSLPVNFDTNGVA